MIPPLASAEQLRPLYALMEDIQRLAPWEWMLETNLIGIQQPQTQALGFLSVMGLLGEHYAISLYLGPQGLYNFQQIQSANLLTPEMMFETPQLMASLEDREMLDSPDHATIKALGLKYRGRQAWPLFRSYQPGYAPYYLQPDEADFLKYALQQVLEVTPRFRSAPNLPRPDPPSTYLVRVSQIKGDARIWHDTFQHIDPPPLEQVASELDPVLLQQTRQLPRQPFHLEMDVFMMMSQITEKGTRPYFPYLFLLLEPHSDLVVGFELLQPVPSLAQMWTQIPHALLKQCHQVGALPAEIHLQSSRLWHLLQPVSQALGIQLRLTSVLPHLTAARWSFEHFMSHR